MQTVEAVVDEKGNIRFLESVKIELPRRVWVTILPSVSQSDKSLVNDLAGLGEILDDDLESGSREISKLFKESLNRSAEGLEN